ncbi:unnamed protein product, partial [Rotaria sordida]
ELDALIKATTMGCNASSTTTSATSNAYRGSNKHVESLSPSPNSNQHQPDTKPIPNDSYRRTRANINDVIQNFFLVWLDSNVDRSGKDYQHSIKHLQRTVNTIETFQDTEECVNYLSQFENEKAFLVISGALCEAVVPRVHDSMPQIYSIYLFCQKREKYEEWAKHWSKVKGIYTEITPLCDSVRASARECDEDSVQITSASSLDQIEPTFMYTQLLKEIILEIDFDQNKEIHDLVEYVRPKYAGNDEQLEIIDEFTRDYQGNIYDKPVWWYSTNGNIAQNGFLYTRPSSKHRGIVFKPIK